VLELIDSLPDPSARPGFVTDVELALPDDLTSVDRHAGVVHHEIDVDWRVDVLLVDEPVADAEVRAAASLLPNRGRPPVRERVDTERDFGNVLRVLLFIDRALE